jgi:hypothetical protein
MLPPRLLTKQVEQTYIAPSPRTEEKGTLYKASLS